MKIPDVIHHEIERALDVVRQHSKHEYGPKQRRQLFALFKANSTGLYAWRWLAVLTARRVLPLYAAYMTVTKRKFLYYDIRRPQKSIEMAEGVLLESVASEDGYNQANAAYEQDDFEYVDWRVSQTVPFKVYMASWSASIALLEASKTNLDQFSILPNLAYAAGGFFHGTRVDDEFERQYPDGVSGENMSDILWARSCHCDTAAMASTAWASDEASMEIDPTKLLEFWEWWFLDAVQQAWRQAIETRE